MKKAVIYGAGNIGRGFLGQLFHMSGYSISFIDVNKSVVDRLNAEGHYPIYIAEKEGYQAYTVTHVSGVDGSDMDQVAETVASADVMATAVGVNVLPCIAEHLAAGIRRRMEKGIHTPLNIIVCENMIGVDAYLAELIKKKLDRAAQAYFDETIGLVEPSIGRMVPATPKVIAEKEPLAVCVEPYCILPVDKDAFLGEIPEIVNLQPFSPFDFHIRRKLYMHNMSHALTAYLGALKGYTYIWEAAEDEEIAAVAQLALTEASRALSREFDVPLGELTSFGGELIERYKNRLLGDTVARVGRDTRRKLAENDRFVGAVLLCKKQGIMPVFILLGIAAGLCFAIDGDDAPSALGESIKASGILPTLEKLCGFADGSVEGSIVVRFYDLLSHGASLTTILPILNKG